MSDEVEVGAAIVPLDPAAALARCIEEFGLSKDADAGDVIQHIITVSGHTVSLLYLIQVALMLDSDIQIYVTKHEAVEPVSLT